MFKLSMFKLSLFSLVFIIIYSCSLQVLAQAKYEWLPTYSAPEVAPVEIYEGALLQNSKTIVKIKNWGVFNPGWGKTSGTAVVGDAKKPLPDSLNITWLSMVENAFYTINTPLPKDKIEELFKKGFLSIYSNKPRTYDELVVGFAPKGFVVVWLVGEKEQVEIGTFKASKIAIPLEKVSPADAYMFAADYAKKSLADLPRKIQEDIKSIDLEANQWEKFHKKYVWRSQFNIASDSALSDVIITYVNGEKEAYLQSELKDMSAVPKGIPRALPKAYLIRWKNKDSKHFGTDIVLNDKEINEVFGGLSGSSNTNAVMNISVSNDKIFLTFHHANSLQAITKSALGIYSITK
jgi:Protein of unknown function (DUF2931)